MTPTVRAAIACLCLLCAGVEGHAQQDVPAAQEAIEPDRPDVTNGTHIVDIGLLQIEIGGVYTHVALGQHAFGTPVTARVGLLEWFEARVGTDGLLSQTDENGRNTGLGNIQLGAKLRLWADPGGVPVLSVLPAINLPAASAERGLGSGDADYTVAFLTGTDLGRHWHVDVNYGIGSIGAGGGQPHFIQHLLSASASVAASDNWNPYIEAFWFSRQAGDAGALTAVDAGAIYELGARFAIDGGVQIGVNGNAPGLTAFGGLSIVVGDILGGHGVHARQRKAQERGRKAKRSSAS